MQLVWGVCTDVGNVRVQNEDAFLAQDGLFAVADGMGGHNAGEVASALAVTALRAALRSGIATSDQFREIVQGANTSIYTASLDDSTQRGMGTTLTALAVVPDADGNVLVANVGDSRTYLWRDGRLERITTDHSYVQELVNEGVISADDARTHPRRNIVTRALGIDRFVVVDVVSMRLSVGDRLVLCSDGLVDEVADVEISQVLSAHTDTQEVAEALVMTANTNGGRDNTTVVVIDVVGDDVALPKTQTPTATSQPTVTSPTPVKTARKIPVGMLLFWVALVAIVLSAVTTIGIYARSGYFIGEDSATRTVVVYRGRPGGVMWFKPTINQRSVLRMNELPSAVALDVAGERTFSSSIAAQQYLQLVNQAIVNLTTTTSTTSTSTTSTTISR